VIAGTSSGSGPPLVLVHGAANDHTSFALVVPHLEPSFTVIAVDRRGRGASGDGTGDYSIEAEVGDVLEVVRDAGEDAVLVGHSYGALLALEAALELDGLPRLALYEPPIGGQLATEDRIEELERLDSEGRYEELLLSFLKQVSGMSDAQIDELRGTPSWDARLAAAPTIPRELRAEAGWRFQPVRYARLRVPTLLLVGEQSPAWARRSTDAVSGALPDVLVRELQGQGHSATLYAPELLAGELTAFLRKERADGGGST
jgi:pimeloyl-ACP methyl ester carboxylesterase